MDIRQLEAFLAVIDHGSFSAAAEALFTVQSNVSTHVARLEAELDAKLLDRRSRTLTPAGIAVEQRGREALRQLASITDELASLEDRIIGNIACGTTPSIGLWVLPQTLADSMRELPEVTISIVEAQSDALVQQVIAGELDIALTTESANPNLTLRPLFDEDIVAVFANDHPLAQRPTTSIADLVATKMLLPLPENPLYRHIADSFRSAGHAEPSGLEIGSSALVSAMAAVGVGVALVPATAAADANPQAIRRRVHGLAPRQVALTTRSGRPPSPATAAMAKILTRTCRDTVASMPGCRLRP